MLCKGACLLGRVLVFQDSYGTVRQPGVLLAHFDKCLLSGTVLTLPDGTKNFGTPGRERGFFLQVKCTG